MMLQTMKLNRIDHGKGDLFQRALQRHWVEAGAYMEALPYLGFLFGLLNQKRAVFITYAILQAAKCITVLSQI
jgi:hypothetical protein